MYNDLISRADLLEEADKRRSEVNYHDDAEICTGMDAIIEVIEDISAVDAEPVRHGRWTFPWTSPECSACRKTQKWTSKFCPNCGAKMDLEGNV